MKTIFKGDKEMKEQLTDCTSATYETLQRLDEKAESLRKEAQRYSDLNEYLVIGVLDGWIIDPQQIDCAISWLEHSDLPVSEIIRKIK